MTPYLRNVGLALPLYALALAPFVLLADAIDVDIDTGYALIGALGWWLALLLRMPFILFAKQKELDFKLSNRLIVGASGPAEELVRLIILLIIGLTTNNAFSVGLGWAAIEIVYGLVQIVGIGILEQRTDKEAEEAKKLMKQAGMDKSLEPSTPFWGALERVSASALHIGFSLMLVFSPFMVAFTIPFHSAVNFGVLRANAASVGKSQLTLLVVGLGILAIGILLS